MSFQSSSSWEQLPDPSELHKQLLAASQSDSVFALKQNTTILPFRAEFLVSPGVPLPALGRIEDNVVAACRLVAPLEDVAIIARRSATRIIPNQPGENHRNRPSRRWPARMTRRMPPHRRWISESPRRRKSSSGSSRRNPCRTPAGSSSRTRVSRDSCRPRRLMERWMCRRWCRSSRTPARVLPLESTRRRETRPRKGIPWIQLYHLPIYLGFAPWSSIFQHLSPIPGSRQYRRQNYHKYLHLRHEYHHLRETPRSPNMPNKASSMLQSPILYICSIEARHDGSVVRK